jgi:adenylate cyclase
VRARLSSRQFFDLLRKRNRRTARRIDAEIERSGLTELTVLAADSSGFTRKTNRYGILPFLAAMTRSYDRLIPLIARHGGITLTNNADNILAVFDDPTAAAKAAIAMHRLLARSNEGLDDAEQFNICIGIHHGPLVRLRDNVYGATVNIAAKIGEDLAGRDEILITRAVKDQLAAGFDVRYDRSAEVGGERIELFRIRYP